MGHDHETRARLLRGEEGLYRTLRGGVRTSDCDGMRRQGRLTARPGGKGPLRKQSAGLAAEGGLQLNLMFSWKYWENAEFHF
jgi:hypothetical protein